MTSWPKRIHRVKPAIERFLKQQTIKPDYFYLWLAESEFPNKEKDIPATLMRCLIDNNVKLCWAPNNEYCHKRWYVYPRHFDDLVIAIDEDQVYPDDLIRLVQNRMNDCPNTIITIARTEYNKLTFNDSFRPVIEPTENLHIDTPMFCGQCAFPPGTFPLEAVMQKYLGIRDAFTPKCDECWLLPWLIKTGKYDITTVTKLNELDDDDTALYKELRAVNLETWKEPKWISMYNVLSKIAALDKWQKIFKGYRTPKVNEKRQVILALNCGSNDVPWKVRQIIDSALNGLYAPDKVIVNRPLVDMPDKTETIMAMSMNENCASRIADKDAIIISVSTNYAEFRKDTISTLLKTYLNGNTHVVFGEEFRKYENNGNVFYSPRVMLFDNSANIDFYDVPYFNPHLDTCLKVCQAYHNDFAIAPTSLDNVTEEWENSSPEFKGMIEHAYFGS